MEVLPKGGHSHGARGYSRSPMNNLSMDSGEFEFQIEKEFQ
jgi:hypothetical protein